jgi:hypothetical protein
VRRARPGVGLLALLALVPACGGTPPPAHAAVGTFRLDAEDYARRLLRDELHARAGKPGRAAPVPDARQRAKLREACRQRARTTGLSLDLRADGRYVVRYRFGRESGRYAGSWTRAGDRLTLRTTYAPSGPVHTIPEVQATLTAEGMLFSGWPLPHDFLLRRVPARGP